MHTSIRSSTCKPCALGTAEGFRMNASDGLGSSVTLTKRRRPRNVGWPARWWNGFRGSRPSCRKVSGFLGFRVLLWNRALALVSCDKVVFRVHRTMATSCERLSIEGFFPLSFPPHAVHGGQRQGKRRAIQPQNCGENVFRYRVRRGCYRPHGCGEAGWRIGRPFATSCEGLKRRPATVGGRPMP